MPWIASTGQCEIKRDPFFRGSFLFSTYSPPYLNSLCLFWSLRNKEIPRSASTDTQLASQPSTLPHGSVTCTLYQRGVEKISLASLLSKAQPTDDGRLHGLCHYHLYASPSGTWIRIEAFLAQYTLSLSLKALYNSLH